ncbi:hypothetical protein EZV61_17325 [Corallincola luteus]|uniref:Uncharacterized protein n=1 Tax=Corallincola luteus TaxID=1775177 RepID=A0ABY2AGP8_9GAMM|nr:hypothetical protein [Corallincola luteus]TCI01731.1 hypothetical protein EZV61_17325 [Corallincola luteus]
MLNKSWIAICFLLMLIGCSGVRTAMSADYMNFKFVVLDENREAVPYTSVWFSMQPNSLRDPDKVDFSLDDLKRVVARFKGDEDLAYWITMPNNNVDANPLTGIDGFSNYEIDFGEKYWDGMEHVAVRFALIKKGYQPAFVEHVYRRGQSQKTFNITLKRESDAEVSPFQHRFDELRHYVEKHRHSETSMLSGDFAGLSELRSSLEELAAQAMTAGDRQFAARIYWYTSDMPIVYSQSSGTAKKSGFSRSGRDEKWQQEMMLKALEMSDHPYLKAKLARETLGPEPGSTDGTAYVSAVVALFEADRERIWFGESNYYITQLLNTKQFELACKHAKWMESFEPFYDSKESNNQFVADVNTKINLDIKLGRLPESFDYQCQ